MGGATQSMFDFFFQAEDGIRDWSVTGVQTCALPISRCVVNLPEARRIRIADRWSSADPPGRCHGRVVNLLLFRAHLASAQYRYSRHVSSPVLLIGDRKSVV